MDFYPNPFEVGDLSTIGMIENDLEHHIRDMVKDLKLHYGLYVPAYIVSEELEKREIPYYILPQYMKDIIDELEVY